MPKIKDTYSDVTSKQIEEWTSSFDRLLANDRGRNLFMEHLRSDGNEHYLEFWLRCERLSDSYKAVKDEASAIFDQFLDFDARKMVDVGLAEKKARQKLEEKDGDGFGVFEEAQEKAKERMEQRFYADFCEELVREKKARK